MKRCLLLFLILFFLFPLFSEDDVFTQETKISDVVSYPSFQPFGRLLFPLESWYYSRSTLKDLRLVWYSNIDPDETVEIVNYLRRSTEEGMQVFYDIYSEEEKREDPWKRDTGLFFFRGREGAPFAVCNAGGGFAYVGAMQDSFPHALELSAWLGRYGTRYFGQEELPRPSCVIMQYTGLSDASFDDPSTFACVGENDGIAPWRVMEHRLRVLSSYGIPTEFHHYPGLVHGFGLGTGTVAEGWLDQAVAFWMEQSRSL